jgi:hypothetical protein
MLLTSLSDAELAHRVVKGDGDAFAELARRYRWLIGWVTRRPLAGLEREDERQEALIGLLQACREFEPARGSFGAIATVRVRSRVWTARSWARNTRNRIVTDALRLEHRAGSDEDRMRTLGDTLPAGDGADPAIVVELRDELRVRLERRRRYGESSKRRFSDADVATALELVAQGKTLREAAAAVRASHPTVMRWIRNAA